MYKKCIYNDKALAYVENTWMFKCDENKSKEFVIKFHSSYDVNGEDIKATVEKYECADTEYALRTYITIGNINFMVDYISAKTPICVYSYFCFENESKLTSINIPDKNKIVVRNGENAFKFFKLKNEIDGNDMLSAGNLMLPDGVASNGTDIKMNFYDGMHKEGLKHTKVFCICTGDSATIPGWHMKPTEDGGYMAEPRDKVNTYVLYINDDVLTVKGLTSGEILNINLKEYM